MQQLYPIMLSTEQQLELWLVLISAHHIAFKLLCHMLIELYLLTARVQAVLGVMQSSWHHFPSPFNAQHDRAANFYRILNGGP